MGNPAATIEDDGRLLDAERYANEHPGFDLPDRSRREALVAGDAAKLLFDIETGEDGEVIDRGVDRMWVIVKERIEAGYVGVSTATRGRGEPGPSYGH